MPNDMTAFFHNHMQSLVKDDDRFQSPVAQALINAKARRMAAEHAQRQVLFKPGEAYGTPESYSAEDRDLHSRYMKNLQIHHPDQPNSVLGKQAEAYVQRIHDPDPRMSQQAMDDQYFRGGNQVYGEYQRDLAKTDPRTVRTNQPPVRQSEWPDKPGFTKAPGGGYYASSPPEHGQGHIEIEPQSGRPTPQSLPPLRRRDVTPEYDLSEQDLLTLGPGPRNFRGVPNQQGPFKGPYKRMDRQDGPDTYHAGRSGDVYGDLPGQTTGQEATDYQGDEGINLHAWGGGDFRRQPLPVLPEAPDTTPMNPTESQKALRAWMDEKERLRRSVQEEETGT